MVDEDKDEDEAVLAGSDVVHRDDSSSLGNSSPLVVSGLLTMALTTVSLELLSPQFKTQHIQVPVALSYIFWDICRLMLHPARTGKRRKNSAYIQV